MICLPLKRLSFKIFDLVAALIESNSMYAIPFGCRVCLSVKIVTLYIDPHSLKCSLRDSTVAEKATFLTQTDLERITSPDSASSLIFSFLGVYSFVAKVDVELDKGFKLDSAAVNASVYQFEIQSSLCNRSRNHSQQHVLPTNRGSPVCILCFILLKYY